MHTVTSPRLPWVPSPGHFTVCWCALCSLMAPHGHRALCGLSVHECARAEGNVHRPCQEGGDIQWTGLQLSRPCHFSPQRAIRVRSHSMETMVSSQKKQHSGGIPGSLSGGISHNSMEVTKTTFSVSAAGPGGCPGSQGAPSRPAKEGTYTQAWARGPEQDPGPCL